MELYNFFTTHQMQINCKREFHTLCKFWSVICLAPIYFFLSYVPYLFPVSFKYTNIGKEDSLRHADDVGACK